jgi:dual specificity tyrosine-phosphorylation-regulated kinase 2/3/4
MALSYLKKHNIVHCDLKPENILLKQVNKSGIKVIDFGSSCFDIERIYTYIQSRFYRAPEIILGIPYHTEIDMWSFGCIICELFTGIPLFPGESEAEQLACIMEVKGVPPMNVLKISSRGSLFFENNFEPKIVTNARGKKRIPGSKSLEQVLKCDDEVFLSFISRCLEWDPSKRLTPDEAFKHDWIFEMFKKAKRDSLARNQMKQTQNMSSNNTPIGRRETATLNVNNLNSS